ncbi:MAG: tRNA uracil 4-sulfurtransferase ThiI [Bacillota bacterium]
MKKIILVRYGEIVLKGLNRPVFEQKLMSNIKSALGGAQDFYIKKSQARIFIEPKHEEADFEGAIEIIKKIFGIVSLSIVFKVGSDIKEISDVALYATKRILSKNNFKTFKVETKRGDKKFHLKSPEISAEVGGKILENFDSLRVDVKTPDFTVYVEVREFSYVFTEIIPGYGGMPSGTNSKAMLLLSGGIDSPVAGWMVAKRGVDLEAIHFFSYPYTSERAKDKVIELARILSGSTLRLKLHVIPFTDIQVQIRDVCPEDELTIIIRRVMMKIAQEVARQSGCLALVTGESIGQVASQTMQSLVCTDDAVEMPVFRPLIGMDKEEVIVSARKIETFETSILPYEDCCTIFIAKHPKTKPQLDAIKRSESRLDLDGLIELAINNREVINFINGQTNDEK